MEITRQKSLVDLTEFVNSQSLIKHSFAVEASMMKMATIYSEDRNIWGCCGLLHDIDFERFPKEHPIRGANILKQKGYDINFCEAILGHANIEGYNRETKMAKALYAVDQLSSFVVACALVRPNKFDGLNIKSVNKKIKDNGFARAVDRENLKRASSELDIDFSELIQFVIDGLIEREKELNMTGESLI